MDCFVGPVIFYEMVPICDSLIALDLERMMAIRIRQAERGQPGFELVDLESLVVEDHPVRAVWSFVEGLDLGWFYDRSRLGARRRAVRRPIRAFCLRFGFMRRLTGLVRRARLTDCACTIRFIAGFAAELASTTRCCRRSASIAVSTSMGF